MEDKHVALIRGINVGRAKRVAMADLRMIVESLGCSNVRTVLNSGNVIFSAPNKTACNSAAEIEQALSYRLGISAKVLVLTAQELSDVVNGNPLIEVADNYSRLLVMVLGNPADAILLKSLEEKNWIPDVLAVSGRAAYLWCPEGILASRLVKEVNQVLGDAATSRNWATIIKIHTLT